MATKISNKGLRAGVPHKLRGFIPSFSDQSPHKPLFNTLTVTASDLQAQLVNGRLKSTQVVEEYHRAIIAHNGVLNAVWELAAGAMQRAEQLDSLRENGTFLGPLHGIPILVKDNINLDPSLELGTAAGAAALVDSVPKSSATVIEKLLKAGVSILGKATMSEMAFFKGSKLPSGWSAAAGHAQSAYVRGGLDIEDTFAGHSNPGGSSSGSAIAVSAGFSPISIGTETSGSLVFPAARAVLYTIRPTICIVSGKGILPISTFFDGAGPMAMSVKDVADVLTVLVDKTKTQVPEGGYVSALGGEWKDIKVGTLDPEIWTMDHDAIKFVEEATIQMNNGYRAAYSKLEKMSKTYHGNISKLPLDKLFELPDGSDAMESLMEIDIGKDLDTFLQDELTTSKVRSLKELVEWNIEHADVALTSEYANQDCLVAALKAQESSKKREDIAAHLKAAGDKFLALFDQHDVDVIIGPTESPMFDFSAAGAFPIATLPVGTLDFNGRPYGLTAAARPHGEAMLIKVMSAWETTFPARTVPEAYLTLKLMD